MRARAQAAVARAARAADNDEASAVRHHVGVNTLVSSRPVQTREG